MTHSTEIDRPTVLILGATGGIGGAVAAKLHERGYRVRTLHRNVTEQQARMPAYDWVGGDAMRRDDVMRAAKGVSLIVHAVNPPGYRNWGQLVLPMIENTIAAARASGARILMPGTVYNYGPDAFPVLREDSPQNALTRKGRIRVALERRLEMAAGEGVPVILVRAGDFFGPRAGNNWFAQGLVTPGKPVTSVTYPGAKGVGHQWAYLPDVAETMARLVERAESLPLFARFHMDGIFDADGEQMIAAIRRVTGRADLKVKAFPWWLVRLASPVVPLFRELGEMRYLWREPLRLYNARLVAVLGEEPRTPLDQAVRATLEGLGCLETADAAQPGHLRMAASGRAGA